MVLAVGRGTVGDTVGIQAGYLSQCKPRREGAVGESFIQLCNHSFNKHIEDLPWGRQRAGGFLVLILTEKHFNALKNQTFILLAIS